MCHHCTLLNGKCAIKNTFSERKAAMGKIILIIDDKLTLCKSLVQNFHELGYLAYYAANESEAIDLFLKHPINVVLLDIRLGEEDGMDVLKHLLPLNGKVPIIMMTAYATIDMAVESIKMGAFDFIQKPINFSGRIEAF